MKITNNGALTNYFTESELKIVKGTHSQLRQGAVRDAIKALKSSLALWRKTGRAFQLHQRVTDVSFEVNPQLLDKVTKFRKMLEPTWQATNDYAKEKCNKRQCAYYTLPELGKVVYPVRIFKRAGERKAKDRYYIAIPTPIHRPPKEALPELPTVTAIDPGGCTPWTTFDATGKSVMYAPHEDNNDKSKRARPAATKTRRPPPWESPASAAAATATPVAATAQPVVTATAPKTTPASKKKTPLDVRGIGSSLQCCCIGGKGHKHASTSTPRRTRCSAMPVLLMPRLARSGGDPTTRSANSALQRSASCGAYVHWSRSFTTALHAISAATTTSSCCPTTRCQAWWRTADLARRERFQLVPSVESSRGAPTSSSSSCCTRRASSPTVTWSL
jgi:hypothetical protein